MRRFSLLLLGTLAASAPLVAQDKFCAPPQVTVIDAKATCDPNGISIGGDAEDSSTFACLASKTVQNRCGPDGQLTRLRAYQLWLKRLKAAESACASHGGTFSFSDRGFVEPDNEAFCAQAVPEVGSNMFEDVLCNFHSECPTVKVQCEKSCAGGPLAWAEN